MEKITKRHDYDENEDQNVKIINLKQEPVLETN